MPPPKSRITQETFDAAVQENIEEFDMEPDEAVSSAVREFEMQGVDLTGIRKVAGGADTDTHPVALAVRQLEVAAQALPNAGAADGALPSALGALLAALPPGDSDALTVAGQAGAVAALLEAVRQLARLGQNDSASGGEAALTSAAQTCKALAAVLQTDAARDAFEAGSGPRLLMLLLDALQGHHAGSRALVAEVAFCAAAAARGHEDNKCLVVDSGLAAALLATLRQRADMSATDGTAAVNDGPDAHLVAGVCAMVCTLCIADDQRPLDVPGGRVPGGRAFQNARGLAVDGGGVDGRGVSTLVPLLRRAAAASAETAGDSRSQPATKGGTSFDVERRNDGNEAGGVDVALPLCGALRALAVNDDICKDIEEAGGLGAAVDLWRSRIGEPTVVVAAVALCRQLANRDAVKSSLAAVGAFGLVVRTASLHANSTAVLEQAIGLVVAMVLRSPDNAAAAVEAGCLDAVIQAMNRHADNGKAAGVQRQGCMALRNICARSPELRPAALAAGGEAAARAAKARFPAACGDVGSAALRDMGCDNYNA